MGHLFCPEGSSSPSEVTRGRSSDASKRSGWPYEKAARNRRARTHVSVCMYAVYVIITNRLVPSQCQNYFAIFSGVNQYMAKERAAHVHSSRAGQRRVLHRPSRCYCGGRPSSWDRHARHHHHPHRGEPLRAGVLVRGGVSIPLRGGQLWRRVRRYLRNLLGGVLRGVRLRKRERFCRRTTVWGK